MTHLPENKNPNSFQEANSNLFHFQKCSALAILPLIMEIKKWILDWSQQFGPLNRESFPRLGEVSVPIFPQRYSLTQPCFLLAECPPLCYNDTILRMTKDRKWYTSKLAKASIYL